MKLQHESNLLPAYFLLQVADSYILLMWVGTLFCVSVFPLKYKFIHSFIISIGFVTDVDRLKNFV